MNKVGSWVVVVYFFFLAQGARASLCYVAEFPIQVKLVNPETNLYSAKLISGAEPVVSVSTSSSGDSTGKDSSALNSSVNREADGTMPVEPVLKFGDLKTETEGGVTVYSCQGEDKVTVYDPKRTVPEFELDALSMRNQFKNLENSTYEIENSDPFGICVQFGWKYLARRFDQVKQYYLPKGLKEESPQSVSLYCKSTGTKVTDKGLEYSTFVFQIHSSRIVPEFSLTESGEHPSAAEDEGSRGEQSPPDPSDEILIDPEYQFTDPVYREKVPSSPGPFQFI